MIGCLHRCNCILFISKTLILSIVLIFVTHWVIEIRVKDYDHHQIFFYICGIAFMYGSMKSSFWLICLMVQICSQYIQDSKEIKSWQEKADEKSSSKKTILIHQLFVSLFVAISSLVPLILYTYYFGTNVKISTGIGRLGLIISMFIMDAVYFVVYVSLLLFTTFGKNTDREISKQLMKILIAAGVFAVIIYVTGTVLLYLEICFYCSIVACHLILASYVSLCVANRTSVVKTRKILDLTKKVKKSVATGGDELANTITHFTGNLINIYNQCCWSMISSTILKIFSSNIMYTNYFEKVTTWWVLGLYSITICALLWVRMKQIVLISKCGVSIQCRKRFKKESTKMRGNVASHTEG